MEFRNYFREFCYAVECTAFGTLAMVILMFMLINFS